jgi:pyruvate kinase
MKKTKIIATVGPSLDNEELLAKLLGIGVDAFRLNFSHGTYEEWDRRIELLKRVRESAGKHVPMILDTKGPEIRTGYAEGYDNDHNSAISLEQGSIIEIIGDVHNTLHEGMRSNSARIYVSYDNIAEHLMQGTQVLFDDGLISLTVDRIENGIVYARVENSGYLGSRKGVNVPGVRLDFPVLNAKDESDILYGIRHGVDYIAVSFVRKADDIIAVRQLLERNDGNGIQVIAKIENKEGCDNIDEIISLCDGIMVARGDLGVEMPFYEVPIIQEMVIEKTLREGKIVITATHMLNSMIMNPLPTRAEVSDVFNSVKSSSSCIMLSGETASGSYPEESVRAMVNIASTSESMIDYESFLKHPYRSFRGHISPSVSYAAVTTAYRIDAKAIVAYTESGSTAQHISMFRPKKPIIAVTPHERTHRQMHIMWGVVPIMDANHRSLEELFSSAPDIARAAVDLEEGDRIVVVAGTDVGIAGSTNALRIVTVGNVIARGISLSGGVSEGTIKVCRDAEEAKSKVQGGDIAVIYNFDDESIGMLGIAAGIIIPAGAYSRSAVGKAAERNIPVIADVHDAMKRLSDGMRVRINADKGYVSRID